MISGTPRGRRLRRPDGSPGAERLGGSPHARKPTARGLHRGRQLRQPHGSTGVGTQDAAREEGIQPTGVEPDDPSAGKRQPRTPWPVTRMGVSRQSHRLSVSGRSLKGAPSSRRYAMA
ncbi:hypothetical protein GCM10010425_00570 [Streptomyces spororaveus]|uniref:Uncharacterized protein n=1 Tax=Streptomyces spororaveus TaxID=284039 RepID=A0ABQ3TDP6_9ACTN|nr:hypothetical protein Sspor_36360 [Streptomyces spororaveus]